MVRKLAFVLLIVALAGCRLPWSTAPSPPSTSPLPVPSGIRAADKNGPAEVARLLFPESGTTCGHDGAYTGCPLTREMTRRLASGPIQYADQLCRCNGQYHSPTFAVTPLSDGAVVRVDLTLDRGRQSLDLTVTHPQGVWVASDVTCAGLGTSTSVFSDAPTLCFAVSG